MRKSFLDENPALRARLETPQHLAAATAIGWGIEVRKGRCRFCRKISMVTYTGLCPACFKASNNDMFGRLDPMSGIGLISLERTRQVMMEGWTAEHDAKHTAGELGQVAAYYCWSGADRELCRKLLFPDNWNRKSAKREGDKKPTLRDLVKAGALIAAEIDRILAAGEEA